MHAKLAYSTPHNVGWQRSVVIALLLLLGLLVARQPAVAQGGPPFIYYVPLPEDQIKATYDTIQTNSSTYEATTFIIAGVNGTVITYDHWEDGYEANISSPVQASTRIYGDGNTANGNAATYCSASCAGDIVNAGDVLVMEVNQTVTIPRNPSQIKFDGRDKWSTNYPVTGGRAYWPIDAGPLMAEAAQFYATSDYGTTFVMPIGENVSAYSYEAFERVAAFIMAGSNQTQCTYNGGAFATLNEGQSVRRANVQTGDSVVCDKPVQVHLITGDTGSKYEVRAFEAFARNTWTNSYYDPVGTTNTKYPSVNYVYNPHATNLTVLAETRFGTTNLTVAPNNVVRYVKPDSAVRLYSNDGRDFYALNVNDAATVQTDGRKNETYDWGHPLIPEGLLTTMMVSGWSPGSDDGSPPNAGPVWVTALANTTLYIDYDADPSTGANTDSNGNKYDTTQPLNRLQSLRIYDTADNDQTGLRLYTLDGVKISAAWGEDGSRANVARPNIDAGTVSLPFPVPSLNKSVELAVDGDSDGQYDPGDTARYSIVVRNAGGRVLTGVRLEDTLPADLTYVANSTTLNGAPVADDAGAFPLLPANGGLALPNPTQPPGTVPAGAQYLIEFLVTVNPSAAGKVLTNTAFLFTDQEDLRSSVDITVPPSTITQCTLDFTDGAGASISFLLENGLLYVTVTDADKNLNNSVQETLGVVVSNLDGGDEESLLLTETSVNSGVFRNSTGLPTAPDSGAAPQDGTMNARAGQTLQADYTDALFGDTCNDTLLIAGPTQAKLLYLSEPGQAMDRIDPVATNDTSTSLSAVFGGGGGGGGGVVVAATTHDTGAVSTSGGTVTFSHTPGAGANRLLLVAVGAGANGAGEGGNVTGVTFGGTAMTQVGYIRNDDSTAAIKVYLFALANPGSAAANVVVTVGADSNGSTIAAGATTFTGVDLTSGLTSALRTGGGVNSAVVAPTGLPNGLSPASNGSASVTSVAGDLVFSIGAWDEDGTNQSISIGAGQGELWKHSGFNYVSAAASTKSASGSSVTVSYSAGDSQEWGIVGVSIKPASGGGGGGGGGVVTTGATTSGATSSASSLSFSHSSGSGDDRLLLVAVEVGDDSYNGSSPGTVTSVKYGGTSLTQVGSVSQGAVRSYIYRLVDPAPGPANVEVFVSSRSSIVAGATTFNGVDQTTPLGAYASNSNNSGSSGSVTLSSASGELVFSTGGWDEGSTNQSISIGSGQSELWKRSGQNYVSAAASTEPGAASVTVSYSAGDSQEWVIGAVAIKPAAGGGGGGSSSSVTFVQTPPMASNFVMPAGGVVTVTAYISASGVLPASPDITATLKSGGSVFATLTNPTATSLGGGIYRLSWSGALAANAAVPASQQVVLELTSGEATSTQVLYDSSTYPSKVKLPTNTVINVDELAFYDAPYPGGSLVTETSPGQTLYIRAKVSDPFGAYDITGATLDISGTLVTLDDNDVVASDDASKTYEYAWTVPLGTCNDTYPVTITANEGFEDITATAQAEILSICDDFGTPCSAHFLSALGGAIVTTYNGGDTVFMRVVDLDQNLNPAVAETVAVTVNGVTYTLTETGVNTGVFEGTDSTIAAGQTAQLVYVDPNTVLPGADVCTSDAFAPQTDNPAISISKRRTEPPTGPAIVGDVVRFELVVINTGNTILDPVVVGDTYDSTKLQFTSANPAPTSSSAGSLGWNNLGPLEDGESTTIEVVFRAIGAAAPTVNNATVTGTPPSGPNVTDSASADVTIIGPDLELSKTTITPANRQTKVGDAVTFRVVITNAGDSVIDVLPLVDNFDVYCLSFISASPAPNAMGSGVLFWQDLTQTFSQNLGVGQRFTIDVTLRALEVCDPAMNTAFVEFARDVNGNPTTPVSDDDYVQTSAAYDFGDAPDSYGTLLASNGARHGLSLYRPLYLGAVASDADSNGQPTANADGDDLNGSAPDDEESLTSLPALITGGSSYSLSNIPLSNGSGVTATLYGWVDFNADGRFQSSEFASAVVPYGATSASLSWSGVSITQTAGVATYIRLRLTTDALTDNGGTPVDERALGLASNGEVEDYRVVTQLAAIAIAKTPDVQTVLSGASASFTIRVTNTGAVALNPVTVSDPLAPDCDRNLGNMAPGAVQTYTCSRANVTVGFTNVVTATGVTPANSTVTDNDDAQVLVIPANALISGQVRDDLDGDGALGDPDSGLAGVLVRLWTSVGGVPGTVVMTTTTDASGYYTFTNVAPGNYLVQERDPSGYYSTADITPPNDNLIPVTMPGGVNSTGNDFLDARYTSIGDFVWYDADGDGVQDGGELGIGNVVIILYKDDGDNSFEPGGDDLPVGSRVTGSDGGYLFVNLPAGVYFAAVSDPFGVLAGLVATSGPDTYVPTTPIPLAPGGSFLDADFGYWKPPLGSAIIGDFVWYDGDGDGVQDAGEPGIEGVQVCATPQGGGAPLCATTNENGSYLILAPAGSYVVAPTNPPAGLLVTTAPSQAVTLVPNQQYLDADFGYTGDLGSIGDQIWDDLNEDGIYQPDSEPGFTGVTVNLIRDSNNSGSIDGGDPVIATASGVGGQYLFDGLPAGTYFVLVSDTANVLDDYEPTTLGTPGVNANNQAQPYMVVLGAGEDNLTADFGYKKGGGGGAGDPDGEIGDLVWYETDGDGVYEPLNGETGIAGVTVEVCPEGQVIGCQEVATNISGFYLVIVAAPITGTYDVRVTDSFGVLAANGYIPSTIVGGTANNTNKAQPYKVTLTNAAPVNATADFGYTNAPADYAITKSLTSAEPVRPGQPVSFTIQITNTGSATITVLPLRDTYTPSYLSYVNATPASVNNSDDSQIDWTDLTVSFGRDLGPGQSFTVIVNFIARADTTALLPDGRTENLATVSGARAGATTLPDKSDPARVRIESPTGVLLGSVSAEASGDQVMLAWTTLSEGNVAGFNLWRRGVDGVDVRLNAEMIAAQASGTNSGAAYSFVDAVEIGQVYEYTLEVIGLNGATSQHALGVVATGKRVYLPLIGR
jgi:uncharacterized repeat protein (TIGR01451 family)